MSTIIDILFIHTWWRYVPRDAAWFDTIYHWFNITEGCAWFVFALLVLGRFLKHRNSTLELWYCFAFILFGLSDFCEAWVQSSWLIWFKLINLLLLLWLRRTIMSRYYPSAKLY